MKSTMLNVGEEIQHFLNLKKRQLKNKKKSLASFKKIQPQVQPKRNKKLSLLNTTKNFLKSILPSFAISNISLAKPAPGTRMDTSPLELKFIKTVIASHCSIIKVENYRQNLGLKVSVWQSSKLQVPN